ncbi:MAG TPA: chromate efflux transporter [Edaphobacter sp.]
MPNPSPSPEEARGSSREVFLVFLRLGCTSFGGPVAHLGYFQKEIVERQRWCSEGRLAELIALAQSLPGPASSQVGFALGILRAGWLGGLAAWIGFTLPSALLMMAFAYGHSFLVGSAAIRLLHGLQLVAVAVVAQAVLAMRRTLAPDRMRMTLAIVATGIALFASPRFSTLIAIGAGVAGGLLFCRSYDEHEYSESIVLPWPKAAGAAAAIIFLVLLVLPPLIAPHVSTPGLAIFSAFYRSGALVFGGGHVVLPLLENAVVTPGWVTQQTFLAGYGAAQALPGPLFSFGAYLGASVGPAHRPILYGLLGLIGIFMPGLVAMAAVLPFWSALRGNFYIRAALTGINASIVGVLIAALFQPLWTNTVHTSGDFLIVLLAFTLLIFWKVQPWIVVACVAATSVLANFR